MNKSEIDRLATEQQDQFLTQLISAFAGYWNALLTGNGLLLATLSIVVTIPGTPLSIWQFRLVVCALFLNLAALLCILWCFRLQRDHYLELIRLGPEPPPSDVDMSRMIKEGRKRTLRRHGICKVFETFSAVTMIIGVLIIIMVVLCKQ